MGLKLKKIGSDLIDQGVHGGSKSNDDKLKGFQPHSIDKTMGNKIVTEADRKSTPAPTPMPGMPTPTGGRGQKVSRERGVATNNKKNPGKRSKKGG
jgi:hypothetical protein